MSEKQLQAKIIQLLNSKGHYNFKTISSNKAGVPDIIACVNGLFVAIEVKVKYNKVSKLQEINIRGIEASKGTAIVAYSLEDVSLMLEKINR